MSLHKRSPYKMIMCYIQESFWQLDGHGHCLHLKFVDLHFIWSVQMSIIIWPWMVFKNYTTSSRVTCLFEGLDLFQGFLCLLVLLIQYRQFTRPYWKTLQEKTFIVRNMYTFLSHVSITQSGSSIQKIKKRNYLSELQCHLP